MPAKPPRPKTVSKRGSLLLGIALAMLIAIGYSGYTDLLAFREAGKKSLEARQALEAAENLLSSVKDAETGQRGYLLTGKLAYLEPYRASVNRVTSTLAALSASVKDNPESRVRARELEVIVPDKLDELRQTIRLHDTRGFVSALALVTTDRGKRDMERIRALCEEIRNIESAAVARSSELLARNAARSRSVVAIGSLALFLLVTTATIVINRDIRSQAQLTIDLQASQNRYQTLAEELELRVQQRTAELEAANKELETFSYSVSHDLRAPLRSIDGFSQAILDDYADKLDDYGKDMLVRVRSATQRMGVLIDDMLRLARVSRAELRREDVSLSDIANSILADLRQSHPARQFTAIVAEGVVASADGVLIRAVLENLLLNAWKFSSKSDHARIEFGVRQEDGLPVYFVRDNGVGFDMAHAARLFAPFQRLHDKREFEGSGIGLATVQRIVHRHGGKIWADAAVGKGATFRFTL